MVTGSYGGGNTQSMHGGTEENEQGYGTKTGGGTNHAYHRNKGYTKGRNEDGKTFNNRYQKQSRGRYIGRMGTQMRSYHKSENENINKNEAGKA